MSTSDSTSNTEDSISAEILKIEKHIRMLKWCEFISSGLLLLAIFISIMIVVKIQIDNKCADYQKAAEVANTYTSIVLGFVAMTVSLIGMVLGFHNTIQSENSNLATTKEFSKLSSSIEQLNELEKRLENQLTKVSDKTIELGNKMGQLDELKNQLTTFQGNLNQISNDIKTSVNAAKGNGTDWVTSMSPSIESADDLNTDERNNG